MATFSGREREFNQLVAMAQSDSRFITIAPDQFVTQSVIGTGWKEAEDQGLAKSRWDAYQELFRRLELRGGLSRGGSIIYFRADMPSLWNGDSQKGFVYSVDPLSPTTQDLEGYVPAPNQRDRYGGFVVYKPLKSHWYLFLDVN
jgi:hypothetical protein